jgi:hypothetical protein
MCIQYSMPGAAAVNKYLYYLKGYKFIFLVHDVPLCKITKNWNCRLDLRFAKFCKTLKTVLPYIESPIFKNAVAFKRGEFRVRNTQGASAQTSTTIYKLKISLTLTCNSPFKVWASYRCAPNLRAKSFSFDYHRDAKIEKFDTKTNFKRKRTRSAYIPKYH